MPHGASQGRPHLKLYMTGNVPTRRPSSFEHRRRPARNRPSGNRTRRFSRGSPTPPTPKRRHCGCRPESTGRYGRRKAAPIRTGTHMGGDRSRNAQQLPEPAAMAGRRNRQVAGIRRTTKKYGRESHDCLPPSRRIALLQNY